MTKKQIRSALNTIRKEGRLPRELDMPNEGYTIVNTNIMIRSHLAMLDGDADDRIKKPYKDRLETLIKELNKDI